MWFKNLIVYQLAVPALTAAQLEEKLSRHPLQPCRGFDLQTLGWIYPAHSERFVHTLCHQHLIALGINKKLLPASIVNQVTKERAAAQALEQAYPVSRRQMRELKERVTEELRGQALTRRFTVHAWLNFEQGWLIVDTASTVRAEELVATLRDALGTLNTQPLATLRSPATSMSNWLMHGSAPGHFNIEQDLELKTVDDNQSIVRYVRHPLESKEVQRHLAAGKNVTRLGLSWRDRLAFILSAECQIKRLQFLHLDKETATENSSTAEEQFDIDYALMTGEVTQLLTELIGSLGGITQLVQQAAA